MKMELSSGLRNSNNAQEMDIVNINMLINDIAKRSNRLNKRQYCMVYKRGIKKRLNIIYIKKVHNTLYIKLNYILKNCLNKYLKREREVLLTM